MSARSWLCRGELSLTDLETIIEWGQLVLPDPMYHDVPPEHDLWDQTQSHPSKRTVTR